MIIDKVQKYIFTLAGSNMYIICENNSALVIDPHVSYKALDFLNKEKVKDITILLTHEHYDHISGIVWLKKLFSCKIICHEKTDFSLKSGKNSRPIIIFAKMMNQYSREQILEKTKSLPKGFTTYADITFSDYLDFKWQGYNICLVSTPGHSMGSCCIEIDDNIVFTGDTWIKNTNVITNFPGGSIEDYNNIAVKYIKKIPYGTWIMPGHGDCFTK